ncbi:SH3-like domain-containing protein [Faunimonas pinastri]|uniref:SH3-like domain-containing protein n=1 Tax=Faunimonas pinastri TaxID=1855383 RepID=A0A1H9GKM6_9HYPH|nr:SH3 domain-containing protein [Faunimonas pinastri]SEQ50656.1 SH3-like domain-containing protein [Faunimonas pinastri]
MRLAGALLVLAFVAMLLPDVSVAGPAAKLPLPRFVTLKRSHTNVRVGPGTDYPIKWIFVKPAYPVEIFQQFGNWMRVRDWTGEEGWIYHFMLSGTRNALVAPWLKKGVNMRTGAAVTARVDAVLDPRVLVHIHECDGSWCDVQVSGDNLRGYVRQTNLWGVYPGETLQTSGLW